MNYGYQTLSSAAKEPHLAPQDAPHRYAIQLYHHVVDSVALSGLRVLEVGSGRGGGASYIKRYFTPCLMVGVDYATSTVRFCATRHVQDGLSFICGDAERLPFRNDVFDAVINVESSHCYGDLDNFLTEVKHVLRPGGYLLFTDFRRADQVATLQQQFERSGLMCLKNENITANIIAALTGDDARKRQLVAALAPNWLLRAFGEFAGLRGSRIYRGFCSGKAIYMSYTLRKPVAGSRHPSAKTSPQ